jgi:GTP cyclohydrolase I
MEGQAARKRPESANVVELRAPTTAGAKAHGSTPETQFEPRRIESDDWERFRGYMKEIFSALGMDTDTPGTRPTPDRFLTALYDATSGYEGDAKLLTTFPAEGQRGVAAAPAMIIEGPIAFHCLCEHHALPFYGSAHVAYVADEQIIGISKLTRLVRVFARRFTVQERLGEQIADTLVDLVAPLGVAVHLEASHLCTRMRGVEEHSNTVTTFWRGVYADPELRSEFLHHVSDRGLRR